MKSSSKFFRKRIIVFGFEGKNNKTETNYFSHFKPVDDRYILKCISCGVTDPRGMINSIKSKRKDLDYNSREDLTFIFIDDDCNEEKRKIIKALKEKLSKDTVIVKSAPIFELWFLNHFCKTTKEYFSNVELIQDLNKYINDYDKSHDYFDILKSHTKTAVQNSAYQVEHGKECTSTEVYKLIDTYIKVND